MRSLDSVFLLFLFDLLEYLGKPFLLNLIAVALVFNFLVLVCFLNVLLINLVLLVLVDFALLVDFHLLADQRRYV